MRHLLSFRIGTLAALFVTLCFFSVSSTAFAQEESDREVKIKGKSVTVEVKDGKVYINGEEVSDEDGPYVLDLDGDGEDMTIVLRGSGHNLMRFGPRSFVFRGDGDDEGVEVGPGGVWFRGDDGEGRVRIGPGGIYRFHDDDDERDFTVEIPDFDFEGNSLREYQFGPMIERIRDQTRDLADGFAFDFDHDFGGGNRFVERIHEDSELREMEREAHKLARDARRAEGAERERLEGELEQKLEDIFDHKMTRREEQIEALQERMAKARESFNERQNAREEIIQRRKRQLLGERSVHEW